MFVSGDFDRLYSEAASKRLYDIFAGITGLSDVSGDTGNTSLGTGRAISPKDAATCVLDFNRTAKFTAGLYDAIKKTQKKFPGDTVHILYAGCGPFAPFCFLISSLFRPEDVRFTLIDMHKRSLDCTRKIAQSLNMESFISQFRQCDAAEYKHDAADQFHILFIEAMQKALSVEPQVAIASNLYPQMIKGGIMVPESVTVEAALTDPNKLFNLQQSAKTTTEQKISYEISEGKFRNGLAEKVAVIFELSGRTACRFQKIFNRAANHAIALSPRCVFIPAQDNSNIYLAMFTRIQISGEISLDTFESGLTVPFVFTNLGPFKENTFIYFSYWADANPGIRYRIAEPGNLLHRLWALLRYIT
ncbi:MAG: hypothetical protein ACM3SM_00915 [Bacteroidota bacterium]